MSPALPEPPAAHSARRDPTADAAPAVAACPAEAPALPDFTWLAGWGVAWLLPFAVFHGLLVPRGFGMFGRAWVSGLWFLACAGLSAGAYRPLLLTARPATRARWVLPVLAACLAGFAAVYALVPTRWPLSAEGWRYLEAHQIGLARMDATYLSLKLPELVFQQALILVLVRRLERAGLRGVRLVAWFALVFGGIHTPIVALKGWAGVPFVLAASGAALVFPPLIAGRRLGVIQAWCVHLGAYVLAGAALRIGGL